LRQDGSGGSEREQVIPTFPQPNGGDSRIEQRDITEEPKRILLAGRKQRRGQKAANQTEDHHDLRVEAHREKERHDRDDRHENEGGG